MASRCNSPQGSLGPKSVGRSSAQSPMRPTCRLDSFVQFAKSFRVKPKTQNSGPKPSRGGNCKLSTSCRHVIIIIIIATVSSPSSPFDRHQLPHHSQTPQRPELHDPQKAGASEAFNRIKASGSGVQGFRLPGSSLGFRAPCLRGYWHRSLNPKKLIEVGFSHLGQRMTMARTIKLYKARCSRLRLFGSVGFAVLGS